METKGILLVAAAVSAGLFGIALARILGGIFVERLRSKRAIVRSGISGSLLSTVLSDGVPAFKAPARMALRSQRVAAFADGLVGEAQVAGFVCTKESVASLVVLCLLVLGIAAFAVSGSLVCVLAIWGCALLGAGSWVVRRRERRREEMREEIPEALQSMKACFQTGYSLSQTISEVERKSNGALKDLFAKVSGVLETGGGAEAALGELKRGSTEPELVFLATALEIQHRTGSSMQRILEATRQSVSDEIELKRSLRTQTAQAKLSAQIVTVMPFALIGLFSLVSPGFLSPFFESALGLVLLAVALGMQATGVVLVRKMLKVGAR